MTAGLPAAPRQCVRRRLVEAVEARLDQGESVDEALLHTLHEAVTAELQASLLESL